MLKITYLLLNCALLEVCLLLTLVNQRIRARRIAVTNTIITKTAWLTKLQTITSNALWYYKLTPF